MLLYLETADPDFIDRITNGPHVPKKRVPQEGTTLEHYLDKMKAEMTQEEKLEVLKDAMVKNILHNSLDVVMSNRVIACKTSKRNMGYIRSPMSRDNRNQEESKNTSSPGV